MTHIIQEILKLSVPERILMVEAIWDSIVDDDEKINLSAETIKLLDERINLHRENPEDGSSWSEVKSRIKNQL
jgi:putative addiction module component (TIGR02574 family)